MKNQLLKNFLYLVNSFPPVNNQNSLRALEISKRLVKGNFQPIILTRRIERREPKDHSLTEEIPKNLEVYKTSIVELKKKYSLRTLFFKLIKNFFYIYTYVHWVPFGYLMGRKILEKRKDINFILSTGPPYYSHMIGYLLKKKFKIPLIIEYRDPWNFSPYKLKIRNDLNYQIGLKIERKILEIADMIIVVSDPLRLLLTKLFPVIKNKPIYTIANGLNLKKDIISDSEKLDGITLTFIGKLYGRRNIEPLLKMISDLKKQYLFEKLKFSLKIFGSYNLAYLNKKIKQYDIQDLVYLGDFLTRDQIFNEIKKCKICLHIGENLNYPTIGFKVWDYLSCRKKIIYLGREDSYTARFLKENNFGLTIPINNINKGRVILEQLLLDIKNNKFNNIIEEEKIEKHTWDNRVKDLIKSFNRFFIEENNL